MQDKVNSLDDLKWSASHQIGDIRISIIQGKGCHGKRRGDTFEVLLWDNNGDIPLSDDTIGCYLSAQDVIDLIDLIQHFDDRDKKGLMKKLAKINKHPYRTFADYQRDMYPKAMESV
tara:strand:- start:472 stop:822 length:351 start_codon:yes stop_codon:yes gene_type:complete